MHLQKEFSPTKRVVGYRAPLSPRLAHPNIIISFIIKLMSEIKIRRSKIENCEDFINLILFTGKEIFYSIFGEFVKEILKKLFIEKKNQFSHEYTYFLELN